jgi:hypothetical protein
VYLEVQQNFHLDQQQVYHQEQRNLHLGQLQVYHQEQREMLRPLVNLLLLHGRE